MRGIIIEDDPFYIEFLEEFCTKVGIEVIAIYQNSVKAFKELDLINKADVVFLDIHMPSISGFDILKEIKTCQVIISSADDLNAVKAFEYNVADYLQKPFTYERFLKAIKRVKEKLTEFQEKANAKDISYSKQESQLTNTGYIFVNVNKKLIKIELEDINVVESKGDYVLIKCQQLGNLIVYSTLKNIKDKLPENTFLQVHRSYIINLKKIVEIEESTVIIGRDVIPISRSNKSGLIEHLNIIN